MSATEIVGVKPARTNLELPKVGANVDGNWFINDGRQLLVFDHTNAAGADMTLTIITQQTVDDEPIDDKEITIAKGKRYVIGFFPPALYNDGDGYVQMTYTSETDIEVGVITLA